MDKVNERSPSQDDVDLNYFVCTLGEAAAINAEHPHTWRTVNEFIDHQADKLPKHPAVAFPVPFDRTGKDSEWGSVIYTFEDLKRRSISSALHLRERLFEDRPPPEHYRTIAFLAPSSVEFLCTWLALMRLGFSVLLLAPQCQPAAIAHLCEKCEVSTLVFDRKYHELAHKARDATSSSDPLPLLEIGLDKELGPRNNTTFRSEDQQRSQIWPVSEHDVAYLHHTSGTSTGLPKPVPQSHHAAVGVLPSLDNCQDKATFTTTPLYHGGVADCFRAWTSGALIWLFPGRAVPITARNVLKSLECARQAEMTVSFPKVQYFSSVPYVLRMMAREAKALQILKEMELVGVGGAALPQSVGDDLVQIEVNIISRFGSAECGFLMSSHRRYAIDKEWQYLRCSKLSHMNFEIQQNGLGELVIGPSWPHMAKRNRDDGSYATADLFEKHPTIACAWKYHSRADSQLTLATGKKFDPAPLEAAIASSPLLKDVLIFGNGEQYPGALLFRSGESASLAREGLLQALWPNIEKLNLESQSHARLPKHMLVVMPTSAFGLEKSSKGTIMRGSAEKEYAATISKAYESDVADGEGTTQNGDHPAAVPDEGIPIAVLEIVKEVTATKDIITENADLFSCGVDSVACMRIRALLQSRILPKNVADLPLNVVYDCGTIEKLSQYLLAVRKGVKLEKEDEISQMNTYVSQYGSFKDPADEPMTANEFSSITSGGEGEVVVLTGATGALGAHVLSQLRSSPRVSRIHCLVRAASLTAANERVSKSLVARNKNPLNSDPTSKVLCHQCKISDSLLGLTSNLYSNLANHTTILIHAAWAVNFSMRLSSFVKDHIAGLQNLINFALASSKTLPPRFLFCSSTASVLGPRAKSPIRERVSHDPLSASPLGYSRSKWVAESICENAHLNSALRDRISVLRIGQLCGDTESGIWNMTEAWPIMLSSVKVTNSLPDLDEDLDWLPVDIASQAVVENALSDAGNTTTKDGSSDIQVLHVLNPSAQTTWSDLLHWIEKLYHKFEILPPAEWVVKLENLHDDAAKHPARKLLGLWKDAYVTNDEKTDREEKVAFEMEKTKEAVSVMRGVQPIGEEQFEKIWRWIEREMMNERVQKS